MSTFIPIIKRQGKKLYKAKKFKQKASTHLGWFSKMYVEIIKKHVRNPIRQKKKQELKELDTKKDLLV